MVTTGLFPVFFLGPFLFLANEATGFSFARAGRRKTSLKGAAVSATRKVALTTGKRYSSKCDCISDNGLPTTKMLNGGPEFVYHKDGNLPKDYGESCKAWEASSPACADTDYPPAYCPEKWCYVHPECEAADVKKTLYFPGKTLYYSYQVCGSLDAFTAQACMKKDDENACADPCAWNQGQCQNKLCQCTGENEGIDTKKLGKKYGESCAAWDQSGCEKWKDGGSSLGLWCCKQWCYVPDSCPSAEKSAAAKGLHYSYYACPDVPEEITRCPWKEPIDFHGDPLPLTSQASKALEKLPKKCSCVSNDLETETVNGKEMIVHKDGSKFPANYGESCQAWESESAACKGKAYPPAYCPEPWCYVDADCETADAKKSLYFPGTELTYSYQTCGGVDAFTAQACFAKNETDCQDPCAWNTDSGKALCQNKLCQCTGINTGVDVEEFGEGYGNSCMAHDQESCENWGDESELGLWCCKSWCYVDESCPSAKPSSAGQGLYYSYYACPDEPIALTSCKWKEPVDFSGEPLPLTGDASEALEAKAGSSKKKKKKKSSKKEKSGAHSTTTGLLSFAAVLAILGVLRA